jgi:multiple sugar transport system ATP-binding protein
MTLATHIAGLRDGALQQLGTPSEIYSDPVTVFVADFMGSPAMSIVPTEMRSNHSRPVVAPARTNEPDLLLEPGVRLNVLLP